MPEEHSHGGGGGGSGVSDMASPSLGNLGAKFSETSFPHFRPPSHKLTIVQSLDENLKDLIPTIIPCRPVYLSVCLSIYLSRHL